MKISEDKQPKRHFVISFKDPSRPSDLRLRLLPGQFIPTASKAEENEFVEGDTSLNVSAGSKDVRNNAGEGVVFEVEGPSLISSAKTDWVVCSNRTKLEETTLKEAEKVIGDYYDDIMKVEATAVSPDDDDEEEDEEEKPSTSSGSLTYVEEMLNKHKTPTVAKTGFYIHKYKWSQLVRHVGRTKNIMLLGDSGLGKTEVAQLLAESFGVDFSKHDMGAMEDAVASLIGVHRLKDGKSAFDLSAFVDDVQKPGVILLDEINRAPLSVNNVLFPCLDKSRSLNLAIAESSLPRNVKVHPECCFIATANVGSGFTGTNIMDKAFENRFLPVKMEYPQPAKEVTILTQKTGIDKEKAEKLVKLAGVIRAKNREGNIETSISIRQNIELAEMVVDGFTLAQTWESLLEPFAGDEYEEIADAIQSM